jgi:hypothetical protein
LQGPATIHKLSDGLTICHLLNFLLLTEVRRDRLSCNRRGMKFRGKEEFAGR